MSNDLFKKSSVFNSSIYEKAKESGLYTFFKTIKSAQTPELEIDGQNRIIICSNNYLGLSDHPKIKEASIKAINKYGTSCSGSRFLNGNLDLHEMVEAKYAKLVGKEDAIMFPTGYHSNLGAISSLVGRHDVVITDKLDHASIIDGCRLSQGKMLRFKHNDMEDLEKTLISTMSHNCGKLIVVDGVFSMEGDIANLPVITELAKKYNARLLVDDAHSVGVLGKNGSGTADHFGLNVDLIMATASKSLASIGGFIAGDKEVINYIRHMSRSLMFTASLPAANVAAIDAAFDIMISEPERRTRLWEITKKMSAGFKSMGFNTLTSCSPIIPILVGDSMKTGTMWHKLFEKGVFASSVLSPAVPEGEAIIRTSYTASHTDKQLDTVLNAFQEVGIELGIIQ